jgi:putative ABC transport system permease protein
MNLASYVAKNALRNARRTVLTVLSIGVSLALIVILDTLLLEITKPTALDEAIPRFVVRHRTSLTMQLPKPYQQKIARVPGVTALTPMDWFGGIWKDEEIENFFPRFGIDPRNFFTVFRDYKPLKPEYLKAMQTERTACLVGDKLVERYGFKIGDRIVIQGDIYPVDLELTVRGIFTGPAAEWLLFNLSYLDELMGGGKRVGTFFGLAETTERVPEVLSAIEALFRNSEAEVKAETEKAFYLSFVEMIGNIQVLVRGLVTVVVFAIVLIAASTMAMAVRDRVREIAVLKTIGFSRGHVMGLVVAEGLLVSLAGGAIGIGVTMAILPNPRIFLSVIGGVAVTGFVGLTLLLASLLLPEWTPGGQARRLAAIQHWLIRVGPWVSVAGGVLVTTALLLVLHPIDWCRFSNGIIPYLNMRQETAVLGAVITLGVGLASSLLPAWSASRMGVLDGLRTVD